MLRSTLLLSILVANLTVHAQMVYIPDANFRTFLQGEYPACMVGDSLDSQCQEVIDEYSLSIVDLGIQSIEGVQQFVNLGNLDCSKNPLSSLPQLPQTLNTLTCNLTNLSTLPSLPPSLSYMNCSGAQLVALPSLPSTIGSLNCSNNLLTELPILPPDLDYLSCNDNALTALPNLLSTQLTDLYCYNNPIGEIPVLPSTITKLYCQNTGISSLPAIAGFPLRYLYCGDNQLSVLPELPGTLEKLACEGNELTELPSLPASLITLICRVNQLVELPYLPGSIEFLRCDSNEITFLPELPNSLEILLCDYNNLYCLPILPPNLTDLSIDGNSISCFPNYPVGIDPSDFNLSVCTSNNVHDCNYLRQVNGTVFYDADGSCGNNGEVDLQNRVIEASDGTTAISDSAGFYELYLDTGTYVITQHFPNSLWDIDCSGIPYNLTVEGSYDTIGGFDFPNQADESCHWLNVDIGSSNQRPCFTTNSYAVSYCNYGTESAQDVYVDLTFPPEVIPLSSSIPWQQMGGGVYRFEVGDLAIDACGSFNVSDSVSCDAVVGSTVCVTAEIFPISPCLIATAQPGWDNSSIEVTGSCNGTDIEFLVENVGSGDMTASTYYRIYQDNALLEDGQLAALVSGASVIMSQPADGATYRLEVDQSVGHPGVSLPRATVEGCASPVSFGQVLVSQENDVDDHIEVSCIELTAAYDPNDKRVVPAGYGSSHLVHPEDSLLEYTIRFQNTGSDTAFTVEVVDTLPTTYLNPVTLLSGASSHPYEVRIHGNGIVTWRFEDIMLPDSTTNESGSQGFVKFKIRTRPDLPNGTVINNRANIYFDFNAAIVTETCFITISDVEIVASNSEIVIDDKVELFPNPTTGLLNVRLSDNRLKATGLSVVDITGREVLRRPFAQQLDISGLSAGNYILSVFTDNGVLREKVVVR